MEPAGYDHRDRKPVLVVGLLGYTAQAIDRRELRAVP
jgi:hypothetical protein